jgi:hypothetical protein
VSIFNLASCNSEPNYFTSALKWASAPGAFLAPILVTLTGAFEAPDSLGAIAGVTIFGLIPLTPV